MSKIFDSAVSEILIEGLDDWVPVDRVIGASRDIASAQHVSVHAVAASMISRLVEGGFMLPGDLGDEGFVAWEGSASGLAARVVMRAVEMEWQPLGGGGWLANTAAGDRVAAGALPMGDDARDHQVTPARGWTGFDWPHLQSLASPSWARPAERVCPACGAASVRFYMYGSQRLGRPTVVTYTWCADCRRFDGTTGPRPAGFAFTDPLSPQRRDELGHEVSGLLDYLDRLWDEGHLPQAFAVGRDDLVGE